MASTTRKLLNIPIGGGSSKNTMDADESGWEKVARVVRENEKFKAMVKANRKLLYGEDSGDRFMKIIRQARRLNPKPQSLVTTLNPNI